MSWKAIACAALALLRPEARDRQPAGAALEGVPVGVMAGMGDIMEKVSLKAKEEKEKTKTAAYSSATTTFTRVAK